MRERSSRSGRQYAAIPNSAMRDAGVSIEARGMLALLMTYSDDWTFIKGQLMEVSGLGRDKFERVMKELRGAGYVHLIAERDGNGQLKGRTWVIKDEPDRSPEKPGVGVTEALKNRDPVQPGDGFDPPLKNTNSKEHQQKEIFGSDEPQRNTREDLFGEVEDPQNKAPDVSGRFWEIYPKCSRKTDRIGVMDLFRKIATGKHRKHPKTDPQLIVAAVERYAASKPDPQYIPAPSRWLNEGRWENWPEPPKPTDDRPRRRVDPPSWMEVVR